MLEAWGGKGVRVEVVGEKSAAGRQGGQREKLTEVAKKGAAEIRIAKFRRKVFQRAKAFAARTMTLVTVGLYGLGVHSFHIRGGKDPVTSQSVIREKKQQ